MALAAGSARSVPAIRFKQWLAEWDEYDFSPAAHRRKPNPHVYLFSMRAAELRQLCDVYKRTRDGDTTEGIQRYRDDQRTARIQQYVNFGYPYGDLPDRRRTPETENLKKPGWLPTAIVINILVDSDVRRGRKVNASDLIKISERSDGVCDLILPANVKSYSDSLAPMEVIDGQHRLWAFDPIEGGVSIPDDFELPVVAYHGLDVAWQAYLFWSINVSPKKINPSHAFDLYPLLRTEDWLEEVGELTVYREARSQELTSLLSDHPKSSWHSRINMLGEKGAGNVSQAAWVRGLLSTFLSTGRGSGRFGLFQSNLRGEDEPLDWSRPQQAAFLIRLWNEIESAVRTTADTHFWSKQFKDADRALNDRTSMLNQDQGIRAVLTVSNDIFYRRAREWGLTEWHVVATGSDDIENVDIALAELPKAKFLPRLTEMGIELASFDWRSFDGPGMHDDDKREKQIYRGSGGYSALRLDLLKHLADGSGHLAEAAKAVLA